LTVANGAFSLPIQLETGNNIIKMYGKDSAGNEGSAQVIVSWDALAPSTNDLWDVSAGTIVTGTSGLYSGESTLGMFGGWDCSRKPAQPSSLQEQMGLRTQSIGKL
jgi:hypothetical protein